VSEKKYKIKKEAKRICRISFLKTYLYFLALILSIMTTNRNRTATAPTYTITNTKAKKSTPRYNKCKLPQIKNKTRLSNEYTGLRQITTEYAEIMHRPNNVGKKIII